MSEATASAPSSPPSAPPTTPSGCPSPPRRARDPDPQAARRAAPPSTRTIIMSTDLSQLIFGRLSWEAIPYHEPILVATFAGVALGGIVVLAALTYFRWWGSLWRDWVC